MKLTKQTTAALNITLEECAEVVQAISKIFRFGLDSSHPNRPGYTNKMHLEEEIGDLLCMIQLLKNQGLLDDSEVEIAMRKKLVKLQTWAPDVFEVSDKPKRRMFEKR